MLRIPLFFISAADKPRADNSWYSRRMKTLIPPNIQQAIDNVMALYDRHMLGKLDLKALDPIAVLDLEKDFHLADKHLDYVKHSELSTIRQSLIATLLED